MRKGENAIKLTDLLEVASDNLTLRIFFDEKEPIAAFYQLDGIPERIGIDLLISRIWVAHDGALCVMAEPSSIRIKDKLGVADSLIISSHAKQERA